MTAPESIGDLRPQLADKPLKSPLSNPGQPLRRVFAWSGGWRDWLFVPLLAQFVVVNFVVYPDYGQFVFRVGSFQQGASDIFPYTWASALLLFLFALWLFHWRYRVDLTRTIVYSLGLAFAATSLFEIIYQNIGAGQGIGNQGWEGQVINLSAIAFGFASVRFWRLTRWNMAVVGLYLLGWILWLGVGYPQIHDSDVTTALHGYIFNAALKVASYVVIGLLVSFASPHAESPSTDRD